MAETSEYITVVNRTGELETALGSDREISQYLNQQGFISDEDYANVTSATSKLTPVQKAGILVTGIKKKIKLNRQNYHRLVDHLRKNPRKYDDIVIILDEEYSRVSQQDNVASPKNHQVKDHQEPQGTACTGFCIEIKYRGLYLRGTHLPFWSLYVYAPSCNKQCQVLLFLTKGRQIQWKLKYFRTPKYCMSISVLHTIPNYTHMPLGEECLYHRELHAMWGKLLPDIYNNGGRGGG